MDTIDMDIRTNITSSDSHPNQGSTSDRLLFDFEGFLKEGALDDIFGTTQLDPIPPTPTPKWEITKLSGGLINITVRVTPRGRGDDDPKKSNPRSVVIKYAPPFVAAMGDSAPFGTFRQVIEHRALSLLGSTPSVTSAQTTSKVSIPKVLKFFEADQVLVLQDLGKWMEPLDSWIYPSTTSATSTGSGNTADPPPSPDPETCKSVGTRLGTILASVHCDATLLSKSQTVTEDGQLWFENPDTKDLVRDEIVGRILPILRPHFDPDTDKPEKLAKIISQDFENGFLDTIIRSSSSPSCDSNISTSMFSMGDLWTGSILVGLSPASPNTNPNVTVDSTEVELGLIDWEFAAPARIGQDIAQLSAWLYLYSTSPAWSCTESRHRCAVMDSIVTSPAPGISPGQLGSDFGISDGGRPGGTLGGRSATGTLLNALLETYASKVKEHPTYAWFINEDRHAHHHHRFRKHRLAVIRSIWILFGREIIYNAIESEPKFSKFFPTGDEKEVGIKAWQRAMIEVGCWYVSKAGESSDEEFGEVVRKERVLKGMYTVSGAL